MIEFAFRLMFGLNIKLKHVLKLNLRFDIKFDLHIDRNHSMKVERNFNRKFDLEGDLKFILTSSNSNLDCFAKKKSPDRGSFQRLRCHSPPKLRR